MAMLNSGKTWMLSLRRAFRGQGFDRLGCDDFGSKLSEIGLSVSVGVRSVSAGRWTFSSGIVGLDAKPIPFYGNFRCLGFCSRSDFDSGHIIKGADDDHSAGSDFKCASSLENGSYFEFLNAMLAASAYSVDNLLSKWTKESQYIGQGEIYMASLQLQNRRMYVKALKLMEWLENNKKSDLAEENYASHLHLICKVFGLEKAERYMNSIPLSFQGELVYRTLLANCISPVNLKKAETVFNKMRDLQLPLSSFVCNQMIMLYKRMDNKKICNVLILMKKENIKPDAETYHLLIDAKGEAKDMAGMEQLVEAMRSEGIKPNTTTYSILAKHYASEGFEDKALDILRKIEAGEMERNSRDRQVLLSLFALLGCAKEVARIWKECELHPIMDEYMAAIEAWGKLGQLAKAEAVFEQMYKKWKPLSSRHYSALLNIYVEHKLLDKGKALIKRMGDTGCWIGPLTWDALVRLLLGSGDVDKAASVLQKASQGSRIRPMFQSYMYVMEHYANLGDIHNTEKLFQQMRQSGYIGRLKPFELLIQAYINAQTPAYGFLDRMKAENVSPNKSFAEKLSRANAFMYKEK
ncbi:unnamed protein product [Rhodiola kirilowii]